MKIYEKSIKITIILSIISSFISFRIYFYSKDSGMTFWYDISMGIFSGAILTLITSIIGYRVERRKILEGFWMRIHNILKSLNTYDTSVPIEEKIDFLINFYIQDRSDLETYMGEIAFLFDWKDKKFKYIYHSIYEPIFNLSNVIAKYYGLFKWYKNGSARNDDLMQQHIEEIESLMFEKSSSIISMKSEEGEESTKEIEQTYIYNKIVRNIKEELNGKYYIIMYGKRFAEKRRKV